MEDARFNAERNGIKNCDFIHGRVEDVLNHWEEEKPDLIVLDPPRTGCKTILDQVVRLKPKKSSMSPVSPRPSHETSISFQREDTLFKNSHSSICSRSPIIWRSWAAHAATG